MSTIASQRHSLITIIFHWTIAALFVVQYYLVYRSAYFIKDGPKNLQYIMLHRSIGICILLIGLLFIFWRLFGSTKPPLPNSLSPILKVIARSVHLFLYAVIIIMPITGYIMSVAYNKPVVMFGVIHLPNLIAPNETIDAIFYNTHVYLSYCIIGIVALHVLAALQHHFIIKDDVLRKMLPFKNT